jgi:hypothetical protein
MRVKLVSCLLSGALALVQAQAIPRNVGLDIKFFVGDKHASLLHDGATYTKMGVRVN